MGVFGNARGKTDGEKFRSRVIREQDSGKKQKQFGKISGILETLREKSALYLMPD